MQTSKEGVIVVRENGNIVAVISRDPSSHKHLVYLCREANCEDISELIEHATEIGGNKKTA